MNLRTAGLVLGILALAGLALLLILNGDKDEGDRLVPEAGIGLVGSSPAPSSVRADNPPMIEDVDPQSVYRGTMLRIRGKDLVGKAKPIVVFGKQKADVRSWSSREILVRVPDKVPDGMVKLRVYRDEVKSKPFLVKVRTLAVFKIVRLVVGGVALFILGLVISTRSLRKYAGTRLRAFLRKSTGPWPLASGWGAILAVLTQSSTSVSLLALGLVDAGLLTRNPAVAVMLGAGLGASATALVIQFNVTTYALLVVALGVLLNLVPERRSVRRLGGVILGLGLVFYGLHLIQDGFSPMVGHPFLERVFAVSNATTVLGMASALAMGAALAFFLQGPGAVAALVIGLSQTTSLIAFPTGLAMLLGSNLGVLLSTLPASLAMDSSSRRTAVIHAVLLAFWTVICVVLINQLALVADLLMPGSPDALVAGGKVLHPYVGSHLAAGFVLANLVPAVAFPWILTRWPGLWEPPQKNGKEQLATILPEVHSVASMAVLAARSQVSSLVSDLEPLIRGIHGSFVLETGHPLDATEKRIKELTSRIDMTSSFLGSLASKENDDSDEATHLSYILSSIRQVLSAVEHLIEVAEKKIEAGICFEKSSLALLERLQEQLMALLSLTMSAASDSEAMDVSDIRMAEISVNRVEEEAKREVVAGVNRGEIRVDDGFLLVSVYSGFEQVGNHIYRIAEALTSRS